MTKRSRESLLPRRAGHVRASFSMNRYQTGKLGGGSSSASGGHTPGLNPPQAGLPNLASLRSPQLPLLRRSAALTHHGHYKGATFSKLFPHNFHTLLALPTDIMLQFLLGFTLGNVVGMYLAQNYDMPNLAKKLEEIKKDLEAKKKPPSP